MEKTKHTRYQDYVIKDGRFVGEFDEMYRDFDDPWDQSVREQWASEKAVTLNLVRKIQCRRVLELGCGLGHFTQQIRNLGVEVLGVDISPTAIAKARIKHPECNFAVGDVLDYSIYENFKPDVVIMAEITWYVLDKLDAFIGYFKSSLRHAYLIHLLNTYPAGVQQYGKDKFTNLTQIMAYFGANYLEYGELCSADFAGCKRTYFLAKYG